MLLSDLINECNESVRVHHASGHFDRDRATAMLTANGLTEQAARDVLAQPVDAALFDKYKTYPPEIAPR